MNTIKFSDGIVELDPSEGIVAFDMEFSGRFNGQCLLPSSWIVKYKRNRMIGIGLGQVISEPTELLSYEGTFEIINFIPVTQDVQFSSCQIINGSDGSLFSKSKSQWDTSSSKPEDLNQTNASGRKQNLITHITQNNLLTTLNEYHYDNKSVVQEGTPYHIHLDTWQAMTGETHTRESKKIFPKLRDGRLFNIKKIKRVKRKPLNRKAIKKIATKI